MPARERRGQPSGSALDQTPNALAREDDTLGGEAPAPRCWTESRAVCERLLERVERALRATSYGPLRRIEVAVHARLFRLAGRVPSYYLKQIAQTVALAVPGNHLVRNNLEVI